LTAYTYQQFRKVLRRLGATLVRSGDHEIWRRIEITPEGEKKVYTVLLSHQRSKTIPKGTFHKMLKQAGIQQEGMSGAEAEEIFRELLKG